MHKQHLCWLGFFFILKTQPKLALNLWPLCFGTPIPQAGIVSIDLHAQLLHVFTQNPLLRLSPTTLLQISLPFLCLKSPIQFKLVQAFPTHETTALIHLDRKGVWNNYSFGFHLSRLLHWRPNSKTQDLGSIYFLCKCKFHNSSFTTLLAFHQNLKISLTRSRPSTIPIPRINEPVKGNFPTFRICLYQINSIISL